MAQRDADDLTKRIGFYKPNIYRDPDGKLIHDYILQFTLWAHVHPLRGGEQVMQARIQSKNPVIIRVRVSTASRQIDSMWQAKIDGLDYDVKEDPRESQDRKWMELLAER